MPFLPPDEIRKLFQDRQTVLLVGAGVSTVAAGLPGWRNLLKSGIEYYSKLYPNRETVISALNEKMTLAQDPHSLVEVADEIKQALMGDDGGWGNFPDFLESAFNLRFNNVQTSLAQLIRRIAPGVICTTNYDTVLEMMVPGSQSVTWNEPTRFQQILQSGSDIYHIHGVWRDPESVVLGATDYERLHGNNAYREVMKALWLGKTIVFIGCSFDGITDPDLILLLEWAFTSFPASTQRHFALVKAGSLDDDQQSKLLDRWRIRAVEYGAEYEDLPTYLSSLIVSTKGKYPRPPTSFLGRGEEVDGLVESLLANRHLQVNGMGGIGKTSIGAAVIQEFGSSGIDSHWVDVADKTASQVALELIEQIGDISWITSDEVSAFKRLDQLLTTTSSMFFVFDCDAGPRAVEELLRECDFSESFLMLISRTKSAGIPVSHEVLPLALKDSVELFQKVSGVNDQVSDAREISALLEGHPLALTLAGVRCLVESMPTARMLARLKSQSSRVATLLDSEGTVTRLSSVQACLSASMESLSDDQLKVLSLCGLSEGAPTLEMLAKALGWSIEQTEDEIGQLVRRSLLQRRSSGEISVHTLIRDYIDAEHAEVAKAAKSELRRSLVEIGRKVSDSSELEGLIADNAPHIERYISETEVDCTAEETASAIVLGVVLLAPHGVLYRYGIARNGSALRQSAVDQMVLLAEKVSMDALARALICRATVKMSYGDANSAADDLYRAERVSFETTERDLLVAQAKVALGNLYMEQHRYDEALVVLKEACARALASGEVIGEAQAHGQLAHAYMLRGDLEESEALYERALRLYASKEYFTGIAACQSNLAELALMAGNRERAWTLHHASFKNDWKSENYAGALGSLESMANITSSQSEYIILSGSLKEIEKDIPFPIHQHFPGSPLFIRGVALMRIGDFVAADNALSESLQIRTDRRNLFSIATVKFALSEVAMHRGQVFRSFQLAESALEMARSLREYGLVVVISSALVAFYTQLGNVDAVVKYGFEAVGAAAKSGNAWQANSILRAFLPLIFQSRRDGGDPCAGDLNELSFQELLQRAASAADAEDAAELIRYFGCMTRRFLPDGTRSPGNS